jgi:hypothetical protein
MSRIRQREMRASCPVAFLAGLILPHQERTGWAMSEI